ncbi:60S ribosomal protein L35 [Entamoeba marina]
MNNLSAAKLRELSDAELNTKLNELKAELAQLRTAKVTSPNPAKLSRLRVVKRLIARILTVMNTTRKQKLRKYFENAKYKPLEFRPKLTRKMRRQLTKEQKNKKTAKEIKAARHFPARKFYVLA